MADDPNAQPAIRLTGLFPWLRLVSAVSRAADPKRLVLAALGLLLLHLGWSGIDRLAPRSGAIPVRAFPAVSRFPDGMDSLPRRMAEPVLVVVGPFLDVFSARSDGRTFLRSLATGVWSVIVWGLLGGAIARIAMVQVARAEGVGLFEAIRFAARKWVALLSAPLSPIIGVMFFAALCALFGLLYRLPAPVGPTIAGALAFLPMMFGLTMALILIGLAVGWPLMPTSVAAESQDGFDALSRSYAYVHQRPVAYAAYWGLAWGLGIGGLAFVQLFARAVLGLTEWGLSFSAPGAPLAAYFGLGDHADIIPIGGTAATFHGFWLAAVALLAHAWIYSYFWTAASTIYLLLRRDVDGTPWHDVAREDRAVPKPEPVEKPAPVQEDV